MTKILPLPVKKNKFGQRVADIPATDYYAQIMEEVLETHQAAVAYETARRIVLDGCGACLGEYGTQDEAEELVDVITCCVTRLDIIGGKYYDTTRIDRLEENFYRQLTKQVLIAYNVALYTEIHNYEHHYEQFELSAVILMCIARLEHLGYNAEKRQKIYQAVNDKNQRRGYFEE